MKVFGINYILSIYGSRSPRSRVPLITEIGENHPMWSVTIRSNTLKCFKSIHPLSHISQTESRRRDTQKPHTPTQLTTGDRRDRTKHPL